MTGARVGGPCCRCGSEECRAGIRTTWVCQWCGGHVCRDCCLADSVSGTYLDDTLCSKGCFEALFKHQRDVVKVGEVMGS